MSNSQFRSVANAASPATSTLGRVPDNACATAKAIADAPAPALTAALDRGVRGLRVGLPREYLPDDLDPDVAAAVARARAILADAGATIVDVSLPHTRYALPAYYVIAPAEAASNLARYDGIRFGARAKDPADLDALYARTRGEGFGAEVIRRIMIGTYVLRAGSYDAYYRQAQQVRALVRRDACASIARSPRSTACWRRWRRRRRGRPARRRPRSTCTAPTCSRWRATWPACPAWRCRAARPPPGCRSGSS